MMRAVNRQRRRKRQTSIGRGQSKLETVTRYGSSSADCQTTLFSVLLKVKANFSHTRYRALGPELIPVYRQSARR